MSFHLKIGMGILSMHHHLTSLQKAETKQNTFAEYMHILPTKKRPHPYPKKILLLLKKKKFLDWFLSQFETSMKVLQRFNDSILGFNWTLWSVFLLLWLNR